MVRTFGRSRIAQTVRLAAGSRRIDFLTEVDWHEDHKLLKVAFPVNVHARRATYEIQYGHLERPTHRNTSWDVARFEVCGHKWADLAEPGYGVALLNDGKYGHDIFENVMRLTLLRSPTSPDPLADRGTHTFTYSLLPHAGDFRQAGVIRAGYELNVPITARAGGSDVHPWSAVSVDRTNAVVEVVKRADRDDATVVRLYESWGARGPVTLRFGFPVNDAAVVDLLERERGTVDVVDHAVTVDLAPFQIVTLALRG
jgi:alpha-mannosidase